MAANKQLIDKWLKQCEFIAKNAPKVKDKTSTTRVKKSLSDFQYFVKTYFPHHCQGSKGFIKLPKFHIDGVTNIMKHKKGEFLIELARGFSKSTVYSFFLPIWLALKGDVTNMILVSKSQDMATELLQRIQAEFESNELLINDFGDFISDGDWSKTKFVIRQGCCFNAKGRGASPRGTNWNAIRPNMIIMDDIDDDELSRSDKRVRQLLNWYKEALYNTVDISKPYRIVLCGNRFAPNMLLTHFADMNPTYHLKVNALDDNGESTWPERITTEDIQYVRIKNGEISFKREYMNTPIYEGAIFKEEWINFKQPFSLNEYELLLIYFDPSYSATGDFKSIVTLGFKDKEYHVLDIFLRKCDMQQSIYYLYDLYEKYEDIRCNFIMMIESVFGQGEIFKLVIDQVGMSKNVRLPIIYDDSKKQNKVARIETLTPYFSNNWLYFNEQKKGTNDYKVATEQVLSFCKEVDHDDFLDSLESAMNNMNKRIRQSGPLLTGKFERKNQW